MKNQLLNGHILTLLIGGLIYVALRVESLILFKWISAISLYTPIKKLREITLPIKDNLPEWFLFSFPDGLWVFSYISLILLIWRNKITKHNFVWLFIIPFVAIFSEIGQKIKIISGTFDLVDLLFYSSGSILPFIIFTNLLTLKKKQLCKTK